MPRTAVNAVVPNPLPPMTEAGRLTEPQRGAVPPPTVPEPQDPQPEVNNFPGREIVAKLDTLLLRAAKTATSSVSAAKLSEAASIAGLDEPTRTDLHAVAERYKNEGKVISAEDFEKQDVQKRLLKPDLTKPKNPVKPIGGFDLTNEKSEIAQKIVRECRLQVQTNFFGDIHWSIARPGWFDS